MKALDEPAADEAAGALDRDLHATTCPLELLGAGVSFVGVHPRMGINRRDA